MLQWETFKAWLGEFFTPGQIVGMRWDTGKCPIARHLESRGCRNPIVYPHDITFYKDGKPYRVINPDSAKWLNLTKETVVPSDERFAAFIDKIDASGKYRTGIQARTALRIVREVEDEFAKREQPETMRELIGV